MDSELIRDNADELFTKLERRIWPEDEMSDDQKLGYISNYAQQFRNKLDSLTDELVVKCFGGVLSEADKSAVVSYCKEIEKGDEEWTGWAAFCVRDKLSSKPQSKRKRFKMRKRSKE